ncbi:4802_t:CDS:2, partial [Dentiscutata heterogama]
MLLDSESKDDTYSHALLLPNLNQLEKEFKIAISDSLNKYWLDFCEVGLVATFLDSRTKKIDDQPQQISTLITTKITQNLFFESIFRVQDQEDMTLNELEQYLNIAPINIIPILS